MILSYLQSEYAKTKWPFFSLPQILNKFGEEGRSELNKLTKAGQIKRREGMNCWLIELINEESLSKDNRPE